MRLIDADALSAELKEDSDPSVAGLILEILALTVDAAPTVDAVPVVHGQWKRVISTHFLECSECGKPLYVHSIAYTHRNYCSKCGAYMGRED